MRDGPRGCIFGAALVKVSDVLNVITILAVVAVVIGTLCGVVYRSVFGCVVRIHFGEESRRDSEARRRRRSFEWRCGQACAWLYASGVFGVGRGISPELSLWSLAAQIVAVIIAALFIWGATARWREPFAD